MASNSATVMTEEQGAAREVARLVDTARYPLDRPHSTEWQALVAHCREQLAATSASILPGFMRPEAAVSAREEMLPLVPGAFYCEKTHNPYLAPPDPAFPPTHPRNREVVSDVGALADDQVPAGSALRELYDSAALRGFIAAVLEVPQLFPYADPLGSLNVNLYPPGKQLGWHFDNADWAVTLMLQPAEAGGVYEYAPGSRTPTDERYDYIEALLDERAPGVRRVDVGLGDLVLFRGRYTLHRVTPVEGTRTRMLAVLSYDTTPGVMLTEHNRRLFFGRVS